MSKETKVAPKYPQVTVHLTLTENAFEIMGTVSKALKRAGATKEEIAQYSMDSMSGDYDNLCNAARKWVTVL
jgi:hypothetical protein